MQERQPPRAFAGPLYLALEQRSGLHRWQDPAGVARARQATARRYTTSSSALWR